MNNKQKRPTKSVRPGEEQRRVPAWPFFLGAAALVAVVTIFLLVQSRQAATSYTPEVTGGPSAVIDPPQFDYGDVKLGKTIKTQYSTSRTWATRSLPLPVSRVSKSWKGADRPALSSVGRHSTQAKKPLSNCSS